MTQSLNPQIFANMQLKKPYATYKKTTLAKVYVTILNPFTSTPEGLILYGDSDSETSYISVWSEMEDVFFKRTNARHFANGNVIKTDLPTESTEKTIEQYSDEELVEVLGMKYAAFDTLVSEITSPAVVYRLLDLAKTHDKSAKIVKALEAKLSELQINA